MTVDAFQNNLLDFNFQQNEIVRNAIGVGLGAAGGAIAATLLSNPIGAFGGAVGNVAGFGVSLLINKVSDCIGECDKPILNTIKNIVSFVAGFFATAGAMMGIAALMGTSITFGSACVLTIASIAAGVGLAFAIAIPITAIGCAILCCCTALEERVG